MQLKLKRKTLDLLIFCQPTHGSNRYRMSECKPLKLNKWSDYLRKLGEAAGLKDNLTQYVWQHSLINVINGTSILSVA